MVEVEAVHLRTHDVPVDLMSNRPPARIDGRETPLIGRQLALLRGHCRGGVIGNAVRQVRLLKGAPVGEQRNQILVAAAARRLRRGGTRAGTRRTADRSSYRGCQHGTRNPGR